MYAGIFILIFGFCVLLFGLYMYSGKGHSISALSWRAPYKNLNNKGWKNIGKWTMVVSLFIMLIGVILVTI